MTREQANEIIGRALLAVSTEDRYRIYSGRSRNAYYEGARVACEALDAAGAFAPEPPVRAADTVT